MPIHNAGIEIDISASIGISFFPENGSNSKDIITQADDAMYAAKRLGGKQHYFFGS